VERGAIFDDQDDRYRYTLWRRWDPASPSVLFIGLNPSTADAKRDDPTVRRMIGFARSWGYGACTVTNLFAWRSTDPRVLRTAPDPTGPANDAAIVAAAQHADQVVACWSDYGKLYNRARVVLALLPDVDLWCLGLTAGGSPRHPLYLCADTERRVWRPKAG
jgi:hypothetical protein